MVERSVDDDVVHKIANEPMQPGVQRRREPTSPDAYVEIGSKDPCSLVFAAHRGRGGARFISSCDGGFGLHASEPNTLWLLLHLSCNNTSVAYTVTVSAGAARRGDASTGLAGPRIAGTVAIAAGMDSLLPQLE